VGSVVLFGALVQGGLTRAEGLVLLAALVGVLAWLVPAARAEGNEELGSEVDEYVGDVEVRLGRELGRASIGLVGTVGAAQLLVSSALEIAASLGLAAGFVGLTIVAIGTSLPELATSLQAARKNETDLIIGNLLGSNIFNSLAVGGVAALVGPAVLTDTSLTGIAVVLMIGIAVVSGFFLRTARRVTRSEGIVLLALYLAVIPLTA